MARLIDADEAYKVLTDNYHHRTELQHKALKEALSEVPTVDAVEVVRCKDCWNSLAIPKEMQNYAERYCEVWCAEMNDDDYCSCGKRREDGIT